MAEDDRRDLTARDHIALYKIEFCGPEGEWPDTHSTIFDEICRLGRQTYADQERKGELSKSQRSRVKKLVCFANLQRHEPGNEPTLRGYLEPLVFESLTEEARCSICSNYKRIPEQLNYPKMSGLDRLDKRELECRCSNASQSVDDPNDKGELNVFAYRNDEVVLPLPSEAADIRSKVRNQKPDKVIGLRITPTFARLLSNTGNKRHSPFKDAKVLYPFLISEAKTGSKKAATFYEIETQTAFPIRTCVQLQQRLRMSSGVEFSPLVWFFAMQGDIFTLSGCTFDCGSTKIYDLWIGRAASRDGALQLLNIMDYINVWARETYKPQILACLAGGQEQERLTPNHTKPDAQWTFTNVNKDSSLTDIPNDLDPVEDLAEEESCTDLTEDNHPGSYHVDEAIYGGSDTVMQGARHRWLNWISTDIPNFPVSSRATIRHIDMVSLKFVHLAIPEEEARLIAFLRQMAIEGTDSIEDVACEVLSAFTKTEGAWTTTHQNVSEVQYDWLKTPLENSNESSTLLRAVYRFRTGIRTTDWFPVRELWCVSCSINAIRHLANIAGSRVGDFTEIMTRLSSCNQQPSSQTFRDLRHLAGYTSLTAALDATNLYLGKYEEKEKEKEEEKAKDFAWVLTKDAIGRSMETLLRIAQDALLTHNEFDLISEGCVTTEITRFKLPQNIIDLFPSHPVVSKGALLLHRKPLPNQPVPVWCLMVIDGTDFRNTTTLAKLLRRLIERDLLFFLVNGVFQNVPEGRRGELDQDKHILDEWAEELWTF